VSERDGALIACLPLLERPRAEAGLTDEEAAALVAFAATAWSDHWASSALDWVDQGVWSQVVADALRQTVQDLTYSQHTRHRAWRYVKEQ
jgi:hypothetical protein